jgi:hypothetical protein
MSDIFAPVIDALCARLRETHGAAPHVEPLQRWHRPFSDLMRASLEGLDPPRVVYLKVVRPRTPGERDKARHRLERDAATSADLAARLPPPFGVAVPVAWFPDLLAIVTEEARGVPLAQVLAKQVPWRDAAPAGLTDCLAQVGRWIAHFQAALPAEGSDTVEELTAYLDVRLDKLRRAHRGFTEHDRQAIRDHFVAALVAAAAEPGGLAKAAVHADLAPGNVLVDGPAVTVLDFAMVRTGQRLHDLAHLWVQLEVTRAKPHYRAHVVSALQDALLRGFDEHLRVDAPAFVCARVLNEVNHFAAMAVRGSSWRAWAYDWHVKRRHLGALRRLAGVS